MKSTTWFDYYNATDALMLPNLEGSRAERIAVIDQQGNYSYAELDQRINQFANTVAGNGLRQEDRILLCLQDTIDFPTCFLGAIRAGAVPIPVNTLLKADDFEYLLQDSRARMLVVSEELLYRFEPLAGKSEYLDKVLVSGNASSGYSSLRDALEASSSDFSTAKTRADDVAFWLYTSGTTGRSKGVMHLQTSLMATANLYAENVLKINEHDRVFSAAKLFFAYGLGNALTFPFSVGATTILLKDRPTPDSVVKTIQQHNASIFFGVPTLYAMMLNASRFPQTTSLRMCISAGEALPENVFMRWRDGTGLEILDGLGSTEMLHIFISNREGDLKAGTSGQAVDGYELRIVDDNEQLILNNEIGELYVKGPSRAAGYWTKHEESTDSFRGEWVRTGDKYLRDDDGYYIHYGRTDDLIKTGGIYVSPMEVENILLANDKVAEAAVVGKEDEDKLIKPKAVIVPRDGIAPSDEIADELIDYVRERLAEYKRPRWIEFVNELPKTATGKIQRFKLRE